MASAKGGDSRAADIIKNWIRNRYTIEFLGTWEIIHNPNFKVVEFDHFKMTAKEWRDTHPELIGNIRDYASVNELICLSNMENLNAVFIQQGISQRDRLKTLNQIAIDQMKILGNNDIDRKLLI